MNPTVEPAPAALDLAPLAATVRGAVHVPGDDDHERLATPWNLAVPAHPVAVVAVEDADDVAAVLRYAASAGVRVAVRATGHGATDPLHDALLVHTGRLDTLEVHGPSGDGGAWARVGAGVRWEAVLAAAAPLGVAPLCGSAPDVGVVGYLTGGGMGPVARAVGLSSDHVRAFEVVTGDGQVRRVTPTEEPGLFWGLRGGKGALGIVTAVEIDLPPIATLFGGAAFYATDHIDDVLRAWAAWSADLPDAATTSAAVLRLPPMPGVPAPIAGRTTLSVRFTWVGDPDEGAAVLGRLTTPEPVFGGYGVMPYAAIGMVHADPVDPMPSCEGATLLDDLSDAALRAWTDQVGGGVDSPLVMAEIRRLGGALAAPVGPAAAAGDAVDHRDAPWLAFTVGIAAGPVAAPTAAAIADARAALAPWARPGSLPNFAPSDDPATVRAVYGSSTLARLAVLATRYDPEHVLAGSSAIRSACREDDLTVTP